MPAGLIKATANTYINFNGGYLRTGLFVHLNVRPKFSVGHAVPAYRRSGAEDAARPVQRACHLGPDVASEIPR